MRIYRGTTGLALLAALAASPLRAQISGSSVNGSDADCGGLKLTAAAGVPNGAVHSYKFQGLCKILDVTYSSDQVVGFTYDTDKDVKVVGQVWAIAAVEWDSKTGEMHEKVKMQGAYAGELAMVLKCAQDPVVTSVGCHPVAYQNTTNYPGFDGAWNQARPVTRGKTTLAEASALSKDAPPTGSNPPPPPPAPATPKPRTPIVSRLPTTTAAASPVLIKPVVPGRQRVDPGPQPVAPAPQPVVPGRRLPARPVADAQELPIAPRIGLASGRSLSVRSECDGPHWAILSAGGEVMRLFPKGSRAFRSGGGTVMVDWGGGVYDAGAVSR